MSPYGVHTRTLAVGAALLSVMSPPKSAVAASAGATTIASRQRVGLPAGGTLPAGLYVSNAGGNIAMLSNQTYAEFGTMSSGLVSPEGQWIDTAGNLYVADPGGVDVQEYSAGSMTPTSTYSTGLVNPVSVTTDTKGNVYVVDTDCTSFSGCSTGYVAEFPQGSNSPIQTYAVPGIPEDARFDPSGNLYVVFGNPLTLDSGGIFVFRGGSPKGKGTGIVIGSYPGGMTMDRRGNLLIVGQDNQVGVFVVPPPYKRVRSEITYFCACRPFRVALSQSETRLFVTNVSLVDSEPSSVAVLNYPSGTVDTYLSSTRWLTSPSGVVVVPGKH